MQGKDHQERQERVRGATVARCSGDAEAGPRCRMFIEGPNTTWVSVCEPEDGKMADMEKGLMMTAWLWECGNVLEAVGTRGATSGQRLPKMENIGGATNGNGRKCAQRSSHI